MIQIDMKMPYNCISCPFFATRNNDESHTACLVLRKEIRLKDGMRYIPDCPIREVTDTEQDKRIKIIIPKDMEVVINTED